MARRRFFVDSVRSGRAEIQGDDAHHLTRVLRVEAGQQYEISDTRRVWLATVTTARKSSVEFEVVEEIAQEKEPPVSTLYLALIKFERFEWAVEKATELGVTTIVPLNSTRSERGLFEGAKKRVERWRRIAKEASEQSRRLRPPEVADPVPFAHGLLDDSAHRIWLDENDRTHPLVSAFVLQPGDRTAFVIGPEGGWADSERGAFADRGWQPASLGASILRAETAVCAALAIFNQMAMRCSQEA
jgi:16S rRNA (uracil1498-N3)-methyltransferase